VCVCVCVCVCVYTCVRACIIYMWKMQDTSKRYKPVRSELAIKASVWNLSLSET